MALSSMAGAEVMNTVVAVAALYSLLVTVLLILERRRVDELVRQLLAMRRDGFAPVVKATVTHNNTGEDGEALQRAEAAALASRRQRTRAGQGFVKRIIADLRTKRPDASSAELEAEAERLRQEVIDDEIPG